MVVGDLARVTQEDGSLVPGVAPAAIQMGTYAAKSIEKQLNGQRVEPFHYWNKGSLATIGRNHAVADIGPAEVFRLPGLAHVALRPPALYRGI